MAFCSNCGEKLNDGAQFCHACGASTNVIPTQQKREREYAGKIIKCPNCGEVLESFSASCPACGMELRGAKATSSVREFALKLEAIEAQREYEKPAGFFGQTSQMQRISKTDEQKINLIKNFAVPNTKEDILEFMILATSNVDVSTYSSLNTPTAGAKAMTEAWNAKIKQVYAKAKNTYKSDPDFFRIQELYDSWREDITKHKKKKILKWMLFVGWIPLLLVALIISAPKEEAKEIERLEAIVDDVQKALEKKEYKLALSTADSIDYQLYDVEMERKWDIQREYWVDKVLEEAAKNGIDLEYTPTPDIDKANDEPNDAEINGGFVEGFKDGIESGLNEAQQNIDEFNAIMDEAKDNAQQSTASTEKSTSTNENDYSTNSIEKGAVYTYGHDEWGLYCATAISDSIIQIERWGKHLSTEKSFDKEYEVGAFRITEAQYEFTWIDEAHTAFSFTLTDKSDGDFKKSKNVVFTVLGTDSDADKGTNYDVNGTCYSYQSDDWHLYRAIPLTDEIIKIECWYRSMAVGSFHYGYDICVINICDTNTDFEWTDDEHTSFTISIQDEENSELKKSTFIAFTLD